MLAALRVAQWSVATSAIRTAGSMSSSKPAAVSSNPKPQDPSAPKEDLWEQALAKLSVEDRKQYVDSSSSPGEVLKKVRFDRRI